MVMFPAFSITEASLQDIFANDDFMPLLYRPDKGTLNTPAVQKIRIWVKGGVIKYPGFDFLICFFKLRRGISVFREKSEVPRFDFRWLYEQTVSEHSVFYSH